MALNKDNIKNILSWMVIFRCLLFQRFSVIMK